MYMDYYDCNTQLRGGAFCDNLSYCNEAGIIFIIYIVLIGLSLLPCCLYGVYINKNIPIHRNIIYWHVGILLVNITTWYWLPVVLLNYSCNICSSNYMAGIVIILLSIALTILDMFCSPDAKYFKIFQNIEDLSTFLARVREAKPLITVNLTCYHDERIRRQNGFRTMHLIYEKVTYTERAYFPFDSFADLTMIPDHINIDSSNIILFQITKKVTAGDIYSQEQFQLFQSQYTEANRYRDQFTRLEVKQELPEITEDRVMTVNGPRPWWTKKKWFYILSCLSISIFQRTLFRTQSKECPLVIVKNFFVDPNINRPYEFDTGNSLANSNLVPHILGDAQPQAGPQYPRQLFQHGGVGNAAATLQGQVGQQFSEENQPFMNIQEIPDEPPSYSEHHKYKTVS